MISAQGAAREGTGRLTQRFLPVHHAQGRVARGFNSAWPGIPPAGAKRRLTNQSAMNGARPLSLTGKDRRNSSQPLHYSPGNVADGFKFRVMAQHPDLSAMAELAARSGTEAA